MVRPLKQWLLRHRHNPYPTKGEKVQLAVGSNMTLVQVLLLKPTLCSLSPVMSAGLKLVRQRAKEVEKRGSRDPVLLVQTAATLQSVCPGDISPPPSVEGQYMISVTILATYQPDSLC